MSSILYLMVGIPGSGKSTWIANQVDVLEPWQYKVISRDEIRFAILKPDEDYFSRENAVFAQFIKSINDALAAGVQYIFIDATHISKASRAKILSRLRVPAGTELVVEVFCTSLPACLRRNAQRTGRARVPDGAIKNMANSFEYPWPTEFEKYNFSRIKTYRHDGGDY